MLFTKQNNKKKWRSGFNLRSLVLDEIAPHDVGVVSYALKLRRS